MKGLVDDGFFASFIALEALLSALFLYGKYYKWLLFSAKSYNLVASLMLPEDLNTLNTLLSHVKERNQTVIRRAQREEGKESYRVCFWIFVALLMLNTFLPLFDGWETGVLALNSVASFVLIPTLFYIHTDQMYARKTAESEDEYLFYQVASCIEKLIEDRENESYILTAEYFAGQVIKHKSILDDEKDDILEMLDGYGRTDRFTKILHYDRICTIIEDTIDQKCKK